MPKKPPKRSQSKNKLLNSAFNFLKYRPRSRHELAIHLSRKTTDQQQVEKTLDYLEKLGFVNDADFADWFIRSRLKKNAKGPFIIKRELTSRFGINATLVDQHLNHLETGSLQQAASDLLSKKLHLFSKLPPRQARLKANQYLYNRGFSGPVRARAIDEIMGSA